MRNLIPFIPTGLSIALGVAIGTATQNLAVGVAIVVAFTAASRFKMNKSKC